MKTNDRPLTDLMKAVDSGAAQLPDFQRGWVWDDGRIKALILSVIHNFPVGAAMFLEYGNESVHFKHKPIEGSSADASTEPDELILDGQQRLTSLYNALFSRNPVHTKTDKGKEIDRYYYLDIEKALDSSADDDEVVISIPATKQVTSDFGRKVEKDLSTRQDEFRLKLFPLNIILDSIEYMGWQNEYYRCTDENPVILSTIHSAKGLEFDSVYIVDVYDGCLPHSSREDAQEQERIDNYEEERRLFYVAITRAKNELYLFYVSECESGFVNEVAPPVKTPKEPVKHHSNAQVMEPRVGVFSVPQVQASTVKKAEVPSAPLNPELAAYTVNTRIKHEAYGEGIIVGSEIKPSGIHIIEVQFDNGNKNQFQLDVVVNAGLMHLA